MTTSMLSNFIKSKGVHGSNCSAIPICYALVQQEQLPTMLPLESIGYNFFRVWTFRVHATIIPSSQEDIFFMSARDLMGIGTLEEIH